MHRAFGLACAKVLTVAALVITAPTIATAAAQGTVTLSIGTTTALTTPGGAQIDNGATLITVVTATLSSCSHFPCTIYLKTNQALGFAPSTAAATTTASVLEYCLTNCASSGTWTTVPNTSGDGNMIASFSANGSSTFSLRYRLNWTGSFASPPGAYTLPIFVTLKN